MENRFTVDDMLIKLREKMSKGETWKLHFVKVDGPYRCWDETWKLHYVDQHCHLFSEEDWNNYCGVYSGSVKLGYNMKIVPIVEQMKKINLEEEDLKDHPFYYLRTGGLPCPYDDNIVLTGEYDPERFKVCPWCEQIKKNK